MRYSIVIPCYNSARTIGKLVVETSREMQRLGRTPFEFVLVNDCSPDGGETLRVLKDLTEQFPYVTVVDLAKNAGQHNATMAGFKYASGDYILCMDDDMQTHPSQISLLLDEIDKGYDVVYGYYPQKKHSLFRNLGSYINYLSVRVLIGKPRELRTSSFVVMRNFVVKNMIQYQQKYSYLQGLVLRTTRNISCVPIKHFEREVGKSNYTLKKLIQLWGSIIGFSIVPLRLCNYTGFVISLLSLIAAIFVLLRKLFFVPTMAIGWPSTIIIICFLFGLNFLFVGLIGEYVGRMFLGMNLEPQYVVRCVIKKET